MPPRLYGLGEPEAENHPAGLEEADLVVRLPSAAPSERLVKAARTGEIGDAERHEADALFHFVTRTVLPVVRPAATSPSASAARSRGTLRET